MKEATINVKFKPSIRTKYLLKVLPVLIKVRLTTYEKAVCKLERSIKASNFIADYKE